MKKLLVLLAGLFSMVWPSVSSAEEVTEIQLRALLMLVSDYTPVAITWSVVLIGLAFFVAYRRSLDRADRIARSESSGGGSATSHTHSIQERMSHRTPRPPRSGVTHSHGCDVCLKPFDCDEAECVDPALASFGEWLCSTCEDAGVRGCRWLLPAPPARRQGVEMRRLLPIL